MKKILLFPIVFLIASYCFGQDWVEKATMPDDTERHHAASFTLNGMGYMATGETNADYWNADVYRYDPIADSWEQLPDYPGPARAFGYGVAYGGKGYVGFGDEQVPGGYDFLNDLWEFDPVTEEWKKLATCPCVGRDHPAMIAAGGKIFVGLGNNRSGNLNDWWGYDIATDTWKEHDDLPGNPRHHPYYFEIDEMAYVGFGHGSVGRPNIYKDFYRFDPVTEEWTKLTDFPGEGRVAGTQFSYDGKGYLLSGQGDDHAHFATGEFWEYTPADDSWKQRQVHPGGGRWAPSSFVIDGIVYFTAGELVSGIFMNDLWAFDLRPTTSTNDPVLGQKIEIFPNPTTEFLNLQLADDVKIATYEIHNAIGQIFAKANFTTNQIDVSKLNPGTYFINLFSPEGGRTSKSFLVEDY